MDIFNLPFVDESVDEILAEHLIEHLTYEEEKEFFLESFRLLKPGGKLRLEVPDLEWVLRKFIEAKDDFKDFYQVGAVDHYFGNGPETDNRWGLLTTAIWGNQNGGGQFHKNGFTIGKFQSIKNLIGFSEVEIQTDFNKGTQVIKTTYTR
jgi:hypothetical protein